MLKQDAQDRTNTLKHLFWEVEVCGWISRKLSNLEWLQSVHEIVRGIKLSASNLLSNGEKLI